MDDHTPNPSDTTSPTFVYFVAQAHSNFIKIGITTDLANRVRQLQTGNPQRLIVLRTFKFVSWEAAKSFEALMHKRYARFRAHSEWFNLNPLDLFSDINFALEMGAALKDIDMADFPLSALPGEHWLVSYNSFPLWQSDVQIINPATASELEAEVKKIRRAHDGDIVIG